MPTKSKFPDIDIPNVDVWNLLFERQKLPYSPDKILFHSLSPNRHYTFATLRSTSLRFGQALHDKVGFRKDDVLAIFSPNDIDYPAVVFGTLWAGGIVTTANPTYTREELATQLKDSGAKVLVTHVGVLDVAKSAAKAAGIASDRVLILGEDKHDFVVHFTQLSSSSISSASRPSGISPKNDLAFLVYSSGTTGKPKGVMLTHRNLVANTLQLAVNYAATLSCGDGTTGSGDRAVGFLPFFHIYGLTGTLLTAIQSGFEIFVLPAFSLPAFLTLVQNEKITHSFVVPRVILALAKDPSVDDYDISSLRYLVSAAAPLTRDLVEMLWERKKIPVTQAFGMSETSPGTHNMPLEEWRKGIGSIGRPNPSVEAKIMPLDPTSSSDECPPNTEGELYIRGPNVFKGYWNNPAATRQCLTPDGWYKSGDVAYVNEDGIFYITDRVKELIKYNGFQVAPAELEGVLVSHPSVSEAAVIGIFSPQRATELPRAYLVVKPDVSRTEKTATEIAEWLQTKVARHKWLRGGVRFVDAIPQSASGKILRRELKDLAGKEEQSEGQRAKL